MSTETVPVHSTPSNNQAEHSLLGENQCSLSVSSMCTLTGVFLLHSRILQNTKDSQSCVFGQFRLGNRQPRNANAKLCINDHQIVLIQVITHLIILILAFYWQSKLGQSQFILKISVMFKCFNLFKSGCLLTSQEGKDLLYQFKTVTKSLSQNQQADTKYVFT